jgi:hypothetical protein
MQFTIDLMLAHAPGDQLRNLGTEIEDEYFLVSHFRALKEQGRLLEPPGGTWNQISQRGNSALPW